jgi:hypothetical protein
MRSLSRPIEYGCLFASQFYVPHSIYRSILLLRPEWSFIVGLAIIELKRTAPDCRNAGILRPPPPRIALLSANSAASDGECSGAWL